MIDDYQQVTALIEKMKTHLPIPAEPKKGFIRSMRENGIKIKSDCKLQINNVVYLGDDGGIGCEIGMLRKGEVYVSSLTHIRVKSSHPIGKEIREYQRERIRKLNRPHTGYGN